MCCLVRLTCRGRKNCPPPLAKSCSLRGFPSKRTHGIKCVESANWGGGGGVGLELGLRNLLQLLFHVVFYVFHSLSCVGSPQKDRSMAAAWLRPQRLAHEGSRALRYVFFFFVPCRRALARPLGGLGRQPAELLPHGRLLGVAPGHAPAAEPPRDL